ncbi:hypothetical protein [Flavobacterium macacae]|uniref:Uncharacterized protein n=1 Tax=Flavobacterium macacae TaxID=2488993 RepID=A0A3P3VZX6_9FLAO|nr:hypothetical protein [Flavobacterium macacae]RRJ87787.1 hypothetical protein EG849_15100 [Flavobacterium macacae]
MMKFLEYLFVKYHYFQVRVGNGFIAPMMAMLFMLFVIIIYLNAIFFMAILFIPPKKYDMSFFPEIGMSIFFCIGIALYFIFLYKNKHKFILKKKELQNKSSRMAILFTVLSFFLLLFFMTLKILQNNGKL